MKITNDYSFVTVGNGVKYHIMRVKKSPTRTICGVGPPAFLSMTRERPAEDVCKICMRIYDEIEGIVLQR